MRILSAAVLGLVLGASVSHAQTAQQQRDPTLGALLVPAQEVPSNILLTFHLIEADGFQNTDQEIEPILTELRRIFRFQGYRLAFKSILNASPQIHQVVDGDRRIVLGSAGVSQQVTDRGGKALRIEADVHVQDSRVRVEVSLRDVASNSTLINASVNLTNGKTVVLGSTRVDAGSGALILAVTPVFDP